MRLSLLIVASAFLLLSSSPLIAQWSTNGAAVYYNNGNVGVGTSNPVTTMHLYQHHGSTYLNLDKTNGGYEAGIVFSNAATPMFYIWSDNSDDDALKIECVGQPGEVDATPRMSFPKINKNIYMAQSGGFVGIGTTNIPSGYKLAVAGNIITEKIKVQLQQNWSDYVFNAGYRLRPLPEVEKYIQQHHHLPEVPSAAEVEKNGLDLGDNQATLLKKVEELTLYLIEQNKRNDEQNKRIEYLTKKLEQQQLEVQALKRKNK